MPGPLWARLREVCTFEEQGIPTHRLGLVEYTCLPTLCVLAMEAYWSGGLPGGLSGCRLALTGSRIIVSTGRPAGGPEERCAFPHPESAFDGTAPPARE
jgi:hypothetical protein